MTTPTTVSPKTRRTGNHFVAGEGLLERRRVGPVDRMSSNGVLALLTQLPDWPAATVARNSRIRGATTILSWLLSHPGEGWQQRWTAAGADNDVSWIETLAPADTRLPVTGYRVPSGRSTSPDWPAC